MATKAKRVFATKTRHHLNSRFVICVDNSEYPASLELHKLYRILPDEDAALDGDIRVIDESGEDYLYPAEYFVMIEVPSQIARAIIESFSRTAQAVW